MARRLKNCPTLSGIKLLILILEANINEIEERTEMLFLELKLRTASRCASKSVDFFQNKLPFFLNVFFFSILFVRGSQYLRGSLSEAEKRRPEILLLSQAGEEGTK